MDLDEPIQLKPVSEWVYNLYLVSYWSGDPDVAGSRLVGSRPIAASCENHLQSDIWEYAPSYAEFANWTVTKENVGHPRVVGSIYGQNIHESGIAFGARLAGKL